MDHQRESQGWWKPRSFALSPYCRVPLSHSNGDVLFIVDCQAQREWELERKNIEGKKRGERKH